MTNLLVIVKEHLTIRVAPFLHPLVSENVYTMRHGLAKGLKRKGGLGFIPPIFPFSEEEKFLANLNLNGQIVYDVGSADGVYTMFFCRSVGLNGKVVAYEPNPLLCRRLRENLSLNNFHNVRVFQMALGRTHRKDTLVFPSKMLGVGSLEENERNRINKRKDARAVEVLVDTLDNQIAQRNLPAPTFMKIDVQCLELNVLYGMTETIRKHKPKLLVEIHVDWEKRNTLQIVNFLSKHGYTIWHVESKTPIQQGNSHIIRANEHLYCEPSLTQES